MEQRILQSLEISERALLSNKETEETEEELFGRSIGKTLGRLMPPQRSWAKLQIQQILYQAEFGHQQVGF